jgi:hypothetical protein
MLKLVLLAWAQHVDQSMVQTVGVAAAVVAHLPREIAQHFFLVLNIAQVMVVTESRSQLTRIRLHMQAAAVVAQVQMSARIQMQQHV